MGQAASSVRHNGGLPVVLVVAFAFNYSSSQARSAPSPDAVQLVYRHGVPHTDTHGRPLFGYVPGRSFFPIGIWGQAPSDAAALDWRLLKKAGFNLVWPWPSVTAGSALKAAEAAGLEVVLMRPPSLPALRTLKAQDALFGIAWVDEPTGKLGTNNMSALFEAFVAYRSAAKRIIPDTLIFVNDVPWISAPARDWWIKWNTAGDVSCHDNYPVQDREARARSIGADPNGIPQVVTLAVASNHERKPVWVLVGAFEQPGGGPFPFRFPTPAQLRAQVFAALIHGATGIMYFTTDSYVSRDGGVIGMSPSPAPSYATNATHNHRSRPTTASPMQLVMSRALWQAATEVNSEVATLIPSLYSPTADVQYRVEFSGTSVTKVPLRAILKTDPAGGYQLMTVNVDDAVLEADFSFESNIAIEAEFEEGREVEVHGNTFHQRYEPFDTHVFHIGLTQRRQ